MPVARAGTVPDLDPIAPAGSGRPATLRTPTHRSPLTSVAASLTLVITGFSAWQGVTLLRFLDGPVDPGTRSAMVLAGVGRGSTTILAAFGS